MVLLSSCGDEVRNCWTVTDGELQRLTLLLRGIAGARRSDVEDVGVVGESMISLIRFSTI